MALSWHGCHAQPVPSCQPDLQMAPKAAEDITPMEAEGPSWRHGTSHLPGSSGVGLCEGGDFTLLKHPPTLAGCGGHARAQTKRSVQEATDGS